MKICLVSPSYLPDRRAGGSVTGCHQFAKLVAKNCDVQVLSFDTLLDGVRTRSVDGISVRYLKQSIIFDFLSNHGWQFSISYILFMYKNFHNYDLIYFRSIWNFPSLIGFIYCGVTNKKFIVCSSGKLSNYALNKSNFKKQLALKLVGSFVKKATAIHYSSKQEHDGVSNTNFKHVPPLILPPPCQINLPLKKVEYQKNTPERPLTIYTVCRLDPIKNIEYILNELLSLNMPINYHIIGSCKPHYENSLRTLATSIMARNNLVHVYFEGFQSKEWVNERFWDAVYIHASFSEGYSNSILEALSRGSCTAVSTGCNMKDLADRDFLTEFSLVPGELGDFLQSFKANKRLYMLKAQKCARMLTDERSVDYLSTNFLKNLTRIMG